jgi:hypothetical protein
LEITLQNNILEIVSKGESLGIRIVDRDGNSLTHKLTTVELTKLISDLIAIRSTVNPEISREAPPNEISAVPDPIWRTGEGTIDDEAGKQELGVSLLLRHPGIGRLGFVFPVNEAKSIGGWLMTHSAVSPN